MTEADESPRPRVDVLLDEGGRWVWSYHSGEFELLSNRSFTERDEAVASARRAFPDVPRSQMHVEGPQPGGSKARPGVKELAVGIAVILLALRNRRRPSRSSARKGERHEPDRR